VLHPNLSWEDALVWQARFAECAEVGVRAAGSTAAPAAPVRPVDAPSAGTADLAAGAFDLVLVSYPPAEKILVIKAIREATGLNLKESKNLSEQRCPARILAGVSRGRAEQGRQRFPSCAVVEVRPSARG
jgi:ribosomal protein L7/L12